MNNTVIKNIAYVASGALFGALGGYVASKKVFSDKLEAELAQYKKSGELHAKQLKAENDFLLEKINIYEQAGLSFETAKVIAEKNKQAMEAKEKKLAEDQKTMGNTYKTLVNYAAKHKDISKEETDSTQEPDTDTNVENFTPSNPVMDEDPYIISVDQFANDHDDFRKVSCTYYTEDNIICETAHNEKIESRHVGQENLDMLLGSDIDILYVRNEYLSIDYEIDKYEGSYIYEVLGEQSLNE